MFHGIACVSNLYLRTKMHDNLFRVNPTWKLGNCQIVSAWEKGTNSSSGLSVGLESGHQILSETIRLLKSARHKQTTTQTGKCRALKLKLRPHVSRWCKKAQHAFGNCQNTGAQETQQLSLTFWLLPRSCVSRDCGCPASEGPYDFNETCSRDKFGVGVSWNAKYPQEGSL